jgi:hypothetical protein
MLNFDAATAAPLYFDGLTFLLSEEDDGNACVLPADPGTWRRTHEDE